MPTASHALRLAGVGPVAGLLMSCAAPPAPRVTAEVEATSSARNARSARLCSAPRYPVEALRAEAAGTTRLRMDVSEEGRVLRATVERSAGPTELHKLLDQAAINSFTECPFRPAVDAQGRPMRGVATVEFHWRIEDAKR